MFLTQPKQIMCIRATPASMVDLNFKLPNWLGWIKLLVATWNWSLSLMTFSISLPKVLSNTMGLNDLGESYNCLLGLEMTIIVDLLKCSSQWPSSIHVFMMLMMLVKQLLCLRMDLRWCHDSLSGPGVEELLQLLITILNSSLKNSNQKKAFCHWFCQRSWYRYVDERQYWKLNVGHSKDYLLKDTVDFHVW